jgi:signal transduction histidine kinase
VKAQIEGERLAVIGQSIVGVAHCVKNILNGMEGGGFIIEQGLKKDQVESIEKGWEMLKRHKGRLKDLVLEMLYVSKEREPELAPTDVAAILRDACELAGERAREKNVDLAVRVPGESEPILADGNTLFRCILNLIGNAIDACVGIEGASVEAAMDEDPSGLLITLAVSDNGPGFPPEIRKRPFLPFQSTKGSKGTGLGLYTTKQMIEAQGGAIRLEDRPQGGAQVVISLLRREPPAGSEAKATEMPE